MAERRMFAKTIIDSDNFLDMPTTAQLLYFHLCMRADDEGFINNPKRIMRDVRCGDDDMKMLIAKKYIIPFESGVIVIRHWKIHNYIQKDRYKPSICEEKKLLNTDKNKVYELLDTRCIQDGYKLDTQVSIGKVSLDKSSIGEVNKEGTLCEQSSPFSDTSKKNKKRKFTPPTFEEVVAYISEKKLDVNAKKFFDYYESGDWYDGKGNKVKNWKQKCITWDKHTDKPQEATPSKVFDTPPQMTDEQAMDEIMRSLE